MKKIRLTKGQVAIIDDEDFDEISRHSWWATWNPKTRSFYANATINGKNVSMARKILGLTDPKVDGDHENHDTLDNRRGNLRATTRQQNMMNRRGPNSNSRTAARGVSPHGKKGFRARIMINGKGIHLGTFKTISEAAGVYAAANRQHFGEFGGTL